MKHLTLRLMVCAAMVSAIILALAGCAAQQPGQPAGAAGAQDKVISQVKQGAITIDGDLKEWPARAWIPVDQYHVRRGDGALGGPDRQRRVRVRRGEVLPGGASHRR